MRELVRAAVPVSPMRGILNRTSPIGIHRRCVPELRAASEGFASFALSIAAAVVLGGVSMLAGWLCRVREADAGRAVLWSWTSAQIACFPLILWVCARMPTRTARMAVLAWPVMRGVLLYLSPPQELALQVGDSAALHAIGQQFQAWWAQGGSWIPSYTGARAVNWISVPYLVGIPYLAFGPHLYVVIPWLATMQLCAAAIILRLLRSVMVHGTFETLYTLYCPAWLFYSNNLYRDPLLFVGLAALPLALHHLLSGHYAAGIVGACVALLLIYAGREQYVVLVVAFLGVAAALRRRRLLIVCLLLVAMGGAVGVHWLRTGELFLWDTLRNEVAVSTVVEKSGTGSIIERHADLKWYTLPVSVPLRIVAAVVAPFPWANDKVSIVEQCGGWWLYAAFHMLQGTFHLGMLIAIGLRWCRIRDSVSADLVLVGAYGGLLLIIGALTWVGFNRYVLPSFVFLLPLLTRGRGRTKFWEIVALGGAGVAVVHALYYVLHG